MAKNKSFKFDNTYTSIHMQVDFTLEFIREDFIQQVEKIQKSIGHEPTDGIIVECGIIRAADIEEDLCVIVEPMYAPNRQIWIPFYMVKTIMTQKKHVIKLWYLPSKGKLEMSASDDFSPSYYT